MRVRVAPVVDPYWVNSPLRTSGEECTPGVPFKLGTTQQALGVQMCPEWNFRTEVNSQNDRMFHSSHI